LDAGSYLPTALSAYSSVPPSKSHKESIQTQHELGEILVVLEDKSADRIEVGHVGLAAQHVAHDCSIALEAICLPCGKTSKFSVRVSNDVSWIDKAYKTVRDHVVLLQHRRSHLCMLVVVMLDEVGIAHAGLLSYEDGGFDDFAEACC